MLTAGLHVVPFINADQGLVRQRHGVQLLQAAQPVLLSLQQLQMLPLHAGPGAHTEAVVWLVQAEQLQRHMAALEALDTTPASDAQSASDLRLLKASVAALLEQPPPTRPTRVDPGTAPALRALLAYQIQVAQASGLGADGDKLSAPLIAVAVTEAPNVLAAITDIGTLAAQLMTRESPNLARRLVDRMARLDLSLDRIERALRHAAELTPELPARLQAQPVLNGLRDLHERAQREALEGTTHIQPADFLLVAEHGLTNAHGLLQRSLQALDDTLTQRQRQGVQRLCVAAGVTAAWLLVTLGLWAVGPGATRPQPRCPMNGFP